jgi:hypothetical protein
MKKLLAVLGMALPVFGQYAGPAILSRGDAPAAMSGPPVSFRPFVEVSGIYSTGLSGIAVNTQGNIPNETAAGVQVAAGISGSHHWRHTVLGVSYRGDFSHYFGGGAGGSNLTDHTLLLSLRQQVSRHISFAWNNSVGIINRDYGLLSTISPSVSFDPSQSYVPNTDFFNNRTIWVSSTANVVYQKSTRLSFAFSGGMFTDIRSSSALYNVLGLNATADVQYRLSRRATIGATYGYAHYSYSQLISNTNVHGVAATFAYRLTRWWEFSGYGGAARVESKFIQNVPVDPAVAAIIGISESTQVVYSLRYIPNLGARISRTFHNGVLAGSFYHGVTPGNGLFLTSTSTYVGASYTYTGLRRWSIAAIANDQIAHSIGNVIGNYGTLTVGASISRHISHNFHAVLGVTSDTYNSNVFSRYNQWVYSAHLGIGWSPGDVPLRFW